ncbi:MAG: DUF971 domain-containing protein [Candidatus Tectomicrobia bacterium]|nr:DUF971 domain-containing protein [Candidatus Tectomicrobia bacterium]
MATDATAPADIRVDKKRLVYMAWKDGHKSRFPLGYLRRICPCATCNDLRQKLSAPRPQPAAKGFTSLTVLPDSAPRQAGSAEIVEVNPVGRYALQFVWSDGHDTGIYSFDFLRARSPADPHQAEETWEGKPVARLGEEMERESREKNPSLWRD